MNPQLDPKHQDNLRNDPMVLQWIKNHKEVPNPDCFRCGWPHQQNVLCGMGASFGRARFGELWIYVDTSNVAYLRNLVNCRATLGFHWRNDIYVARRGESVVVSRIEVFNTTPSFKQWEIPVNEFASIICAASIGGESAERYQSAIEFLALDTPQTGEGDDFHTGDHSIIDALSAAKCDVESILEELGTETVDLEQITDLAQSASDALDVVQPYLIAAVRAASPQRDPETPPQVEEDFRKKLEAVSARLLMWADEIDNCAEGAHAGINAPIYSMREESDQIKDLLDMHAPQRDPETREQEKSEHGLRAGAKRHDL